MHSMAFSFCEEIYIMKSHKEHQMGGYILFIIGCIAGGIVGEKLFDIVINVLMK